MNFFFASLTFPRVDPIPLPAPVWFFKFFHELTLSLHFLFLHMLIGGLILGVVWNAWGHMCGKNKMVQGSGVLVSRLPILMTYVINLGVPPLLFTQVLYGQALYTSSILIGVFWISVIFVLILGYFLLYRAGKLAETGTAWWGWGLVSLLCIFYIGKVYSTNMTLMLTPEVWSQMYLETARGTSMPPHDATRLPRFLMMMAGSLGFGCLLMALYSGKRALGQDVREFLRVGCGMAGLVGLGLVLVSGVWGYRVQPAFVHEAFESSPVYSGLLWGWLVSVVVGMCVAGFLMMRPTGWSWGHVCAVVVPSVLGVGSFVLIRSYVRDVTLLVKGLDVWASPVNTNWLVVGLFLGTALVGVGVLVWLLLVLRNAKPAEENYVR